MKYTTKQLSDTNTLVSVTLDVTDIKKAKELAIKKLGKTVKVQGFRRGKVPTAVVEKNVDPNALGNETVEMAINMALVEAVDQAKLRVLDQPKIELKKFVPYTQLEFTADLPVLGDIKLGDYKKLTAKLAKAKVVTEEIDQVIDRMRQAFAEKNEVKRAVKDGDEVVIDFDGRDGDNAPVDGAKGDDYTLQIGSQTFIPGFEEKLIGHKPGEAFDIQLTFPKDYHAEHLKGAEVTFKINLKKVSDIVLPPVDDALAKKAGPFETAKQLRDDIKRELMAQQEQALLGHYKDDLLGELAEKSTVPVPEVLVNDQIQAIERDMMQNLMYRGMAVDQYLKSQGYKDLEDWRAKEARESAIRRVKSGLVLSELSKLEAIDISARELEAELTKRKEEAPKMAEQLDTPEARRDLANRVISEKTINRLVELNS